MYTTPWEHSLMTHHPPALAKLTSHASMQWCCLAAAAGQSTARMRSSLHRNERDVCCAQVLLNLQALSWTAGCQRTSPGALMASVTPPGLTVPSAAHMAGTGWVRTLHNCPHEVKYVICTKTAVTAVPLMSSLQISIAGEPGLYGRFCMHEPAACTFGMPAGQAC